ncbi:MAG: hypothetical protein L6R41_006953, partial [Letrouitia leprolyta]
MGPESSQSSDSLSPSDYLIECHSPLAHISDSSAPTSRESFVDFVAKERTHYANKANGARRPPFVLDNRITGAFRNYSVVLTDSDGKRTEQPLKLDFYHWNFLPQWVYIVATVNGDLSILYPKKGGYGGYSLHRWLGHEYGLSQKPVAKPFLDRPSGQRSRKRKINGDSSYTPPLDDDVIYVTSRPADLIRSHTFVKIEDESDYVIDNSLYDATPLPSPRCHQTYPSAQHEESSDDESFPTSYYHRGNRLSPRARNSADDEISTEFTGLTERTSDAADKSSDHHVASAFPSPSNRIEDTLSPGSVLGKTT